MHPSSTLADIEAHMEAQAHTNTPAPIEMHTCRHAGMHKHVCRCIHADTHAQTCAHQPIGFEISGRPIRERIGTSG